jgi:predicted nucleic acid-binding protein
VSRTLVDASAIIHLDRIGELELLRHLLRTITITQDVLEECLGGPRPVLALRKPAPRWIVILPRSRRRYEAFGLGRGEASLLCAARRNDRLILDDAQARAVASARGLEHVGLVGLVAAAVRSRRVSPARGIKILDGLAATDFRISPALYARLKQVMESRETR